MALPWDSVDATNWELGPCKFGQWRSFGKMSVRGSNQNLRSEVEYYLKLERKARSKFGKLLEGLGSEHNYRLSSASKNSPRDLSEAF